MTSNIKEREDIGQDDHISTMYIHFHTNFNFVYAEQTRNARLTIL